MNSSNQSAETIDSESFKNSLSKYLPHYHSPLLDALGASENNEKRSYYLDQNFFQSTKTNKIEFPVADGNIKLKRLLITLKQAYAQSNDLLSVMNKSTENKNEAEKQHDLKIKLALQFADQVGNIFNECHAIGNCEALLFGLQKQKRVGEIIKKNIVNASGCEFYVFQTHAATAPLFKNLKIPLFDVPLSYFNAPEISLFQPLSKENQKNACIDQQIASQSANPHLTKANQVFLASIQPPLSSLCMQKEKIQQCLPEQVIASSTQVLNNNNNNSISQEQQLLICPLAQQQSQKLHELGCTKNNESLEEAGQAGRKSAKANLETDIQNKTLKINLVNEEQQQQDYAKDQQKQQEEKGANDSRKEQEGDSNSRYPTPPTNKKHKRSHSSAVSDTLKKQLKSQDGSSKASSFSIEESAAQYNSVALHKQQANQNEESLVFNDHELQKQLIQQEKQIVPIVKRVLENVEKSKQKFMTSRELEMWLHQQMDMEALSIIITYPHIANRILRIFKQPKWN